MLPSLPTLLRRRLRPLPPLVPLLAAASLLLSPLCSAHPEPSPSCAFSAGDHHHHDGDHHHHHHHADPSPSCTLSAGVHHHHDHDHHHHHLDHLEPQPTKLPEELAEEEDLKLYGFDYHHHHHSHGGPDLELAPIIGLWARAMGCSLLVSMASLICLTILPVIFLKGKPSKAVVDSLAVFGAGAMLGDAFLHQLPHAFGGEHSHSHEHHISNGHDHHHEHGHSHSLEDLSVGLSILSGIVLFLLVEKVVRYVEDHTANGDRDLGHGHHHHHHIHYRKLKNDDENHDNSDSKLDNSNDGGTQDMASKKLLDGESNDCLNNEKHSEHETLLRKRATSSCATTDDRKDIDAGDGSLTKKPSSSEVDPSRLPSSLVFGYLNLFSDGVHNFTDGMALGSAFLLHGSVGGWSRTLFLLAHEIPQEVGDFGILVRSGFTVSKALFFNFLSALVALAGTALALVLGKDPGQSSLIEGFTAGGFIYIAVAGVLPEMNKEKTTFKSTAVQLTSLILGMAVALCISLVE